MEQIELEQQYAALLRDELFDKLELRAEDPNIFKVLGLGHYEIRHSNFLAWLLDPNENHGLGELFLNRFLQNILLSEQTNKVSILELGGLDYRKVEVRREWRNIDLLIITERFVVCVENKIWSGEHSDQLKKYKDIADSEFGSKPKVYVFLSPSGSKSSMNKVYVPYGYASILQSLEEISTSKEETINDRAKVYIEDYIENLKRSVMNDNEVNKWARQLYLNHKGLFDLVFENRPDYWLEFEEKLIKSLDSSEIDIVYGSRKKGFVRFYPASLKSIVFKDGGKPGWKNKEHFLIEYDFLLGKDLTFKLSVAPSTSEDHHTKKIEKVLSDLANETQESHDDSTDWHNYFASTIDWDIRSIMSGWNDTSDKELSDFLNRNLEIVGLVEERLNNAFSESSTEGNTE